MTGEVLLHLALGLGEEGEIPPVAEQAGGRADGERSRVPQRIQQARPAAELADALGAPCEVVLFLACCLLQGLARLRLPRSKRLPLIKRLRANLTDVVHPHQGCGVRFRFLFQSRLRNSFGRRRPLAPRDPGDGPQRAIEFGNQSIHPGTINETGAEAPVSLLPAARSRSDEAC